MSLFTKKKTSSFIEQIHLCYNSKKKITVEDINEAKLQSYNLLVKDYVFNGKIEFDFNKMLIRFNKAISDSIKIEEFNILDAIFNKNDVLIYGGKHVNNYAVQIDKEGIVFFYVGDVNKRIYPYSNQWVITII